MKKLPLLLLLLVCISSSYGQMGLSFNDFERKGIKVMSFDSLYKNALHADSAKAVFITENEQETMGKEWMKLLKDFGNFLTENGFLWPAPTKCFNKVYFYPDGSIEYFLYSFMPGNEALSNEQLEKFNELLNTFIKDYKISLTATEKFTQCGPVSFKPKPVQVKE